MRVVSCFVVFGLACGSGSVSVSEEVAPRETQTPANQPPIAPGSANVDNAGIPTDSRLHDSRAQGTPVELSTAERIRADVSVGAPEVSGDGEFDVAIVRRTVRARLAAFRRCYETVLRAQPDVAGSVSLRFTIETRGTVRDASAVDNTTGDSELAQCMINDARRFRFNPGPTGGDMTYEFPVTLAVGD